MIKRIVFGFIWFVVLYLGSCTITGAIVGGMLASRTSGKISNEEAANAGAGAVLAIREYLLFGTALAAGLGTLAGVLPGTKPSSNLS